ncbi:hypothetical protein AAT19DRAFT_13533 [Rhodotorula toruloides]|uniref:Uncharacterized protein n=1 Tax=Rhodotorula toruloides TaxID=5286 RepID=A0A2T0ABU6_RHOTO|nr:hypothetical protein AAT19DRAFT_13533 [Rhodotorula toruloides]
MSRAVPCGSVQSASTCRHLRRPYRPGRTSARATLATWDHPARSIQAKAGLAVSAVLLPGRAARNACAVLPVSPYAPPLSSGANCARESVSGESRNTPLVRPAAIPPRVPL